MRIHRQRETENGRETLFGSNRWISLEYVKPEWGEEREPSFRYRNIRYFLSEAIRLENEDPFFAGIHGYIGLTYFSTVMVQVSEDGEKVKAFIYCT